MLALAKSSVLNGITGEKCHSYYPSICLFIMIYFCRDIFKKGCFLYVFSFSVSIFSAAAFLLFMLYSSLLCPCTLCSCPISIWMINMSALLQSEVHLCLPSCWGYVFFILKGLFNPFTSLVYKVEKECFLCATMFRVSSVH